MEDDGVGITEEILANIKEKLKDVYKRQMILCNNLPKMRRNIMSNSISQDFKLYSLLKFALPSMVMMVFMLSLIHI